MVSQYAGSALAESPLAVAAAANLRAATTEYLVGTVIKNEALPEQVLIWTATSAGVDRFNLKANNGVLAENDAQELIL